ncbi:HDOD domain-containing protein [Geobacter sp. DSM 9736]|uniref:HDOD domain-containing protein n=1 Tax=Geobacter sp. DSM 9736 TaxID=1277350 RepID=UPI000B5F0A27|nr:HDOD domain-containing protein [Geobacter sp. DSM 9736]SNB46150.1 HD-like signal output (HDOD) domain, no enzymatic activity [Geobacter sp. DSM 9736]
MPVSLAIRRILSIYPIDLPVFHPIALKLVYMLSGTEFTIDEVIDLANQDQSIAVKVLRMANSPAFRGNEPVSTMHEAVVRLGAQQVANIAMTASQASVHVSDNETINRYMRKLWQHSHACAVGCRWAAVSAGLSRMADQAYMAGLLHDIGKLYLLKVLEKLSRSGVARSALEEETLLDVFKEMHVEEGEKLMEHWRMPPLLCKVVGRHHDAECEVDDLILIIARLVNSVSSRIGLSLHPNPRLETARLKEMSYLNFDAGKLAGLETALEEAGALVY